MIRISLVASIIVIAVFLCLPGCRESGTQHDNAFRQGWSVRHIDRPNGGREEIWSHPDYNYWVVVVGGSCYLMKKQSKPQTSGGIACPDPNFMPAREHFGGNPRGRRLRIIAMWVIDDVAWCLIGANQCIAGGSHSDGRDFTVVAGWQSFDLKTGGVEYFEHIPLGMKKNLSNSQPLVSELHNLEVRRCPSGSPPDLK